MSYSLTIKKRTSGFFGRFIKKTVTPDVLLQRLQGMDVEIADEDDLRKEISDCTFFIPKASTRGACVLDRGEAFEVVVNACASKEDYLLAFRLAAELSKLTNADVEDEYCEPIPLARFTSRFNESYAEDLKMHGFSSVVAIVKEHNTLTVPACVRPVYIGPHVISQCNTSDASALYNTLVSVIRKVQYIDDIARVPRLFSVTSEDEEAWTYIVIVDQCLQLLAKADFVIFALADEETYKVRFGVVQEYANMHFERLDEEQYLFPGKHPN